MKNLLIYQSTEYDCGPTTLTNAIRYLFDREEIYPISSNGIMLYCLDSYNEAGEVGKTRYIRICHDVFEQLAHTVRTGKKLPDLLQFSR